MFALTNDITIGKYSFNYIVDVKINTSTDQLTDTAIVTVPNKLQFQGKPIAVGDNKIFKREDKVEINLGYNGRNNVVFTGYIKNIKSGSPVVLECENEMFLLKKTPITATYASVTLDELLKEHLPSGLTYKAVNVNLGKFRINGATLAKVLEEIKKSYGLYCYFRDGKLYAGLHDYDEYRVEHTFKFGKNIINQGTDLTYKIKEDIKLKVKCISIYDDNTRLEVDLPSTDAEGELRTLYFYNKTEAELAMLGNIEIEKLKYDGYSGKFEAFGEPFVKKGDAVKILDDKFKEREGLYLVKAVNYPFGLGGYRQVIEIDKKLSRPQL